MAQIMKYWMWPPCGSSSHKYDPDYSCSHGCDGFGKREVNFRNRYYDWSDSSMPLNKPSDAIALLMSDIGVAVEMDYAPDVSGALPGDAFQKYFRYEGGDFKEKKDFLDADWIDKLVADLDNGRPIWYTGCGWMGCHAFVCDGYDFLLFLHFFHFNWGWDGRFDGWFFLDLLRPQLGIDDYSQSQRAIFGLEPVHSGTISIIYVDDDYTWDGYNDGHTWNVDAFNKINDAIFAAPIDGGTVCVAAGTYYESIDLKGKSIHLYAVSGPTSTIINGGGAEHVVKCVAGEDANTVIEGFTITGGNFPGIVGRGAGMYNEGSSPTVTNCIFINNNATAGGGMCNYNSSNPTLTNCIFSGNSADYGAGMWNNNSSSPTVINCTFTNNTSGLVCSMFNQAGSNPAVTNCIFWNSTASEILNNSSSITVTYSDVKGGYSGTGNIDADPCFVDASVGNYRLLENSSCINAGDPNYVPELGEIDLDGNPRVMDDRIDMGAYEFGTLNTAPVACIVGGNQIIEAQGPFGAKVTLDGSCSSDADSTPGTNDDDINDFDWYVVDACDPNYEDYLGSGEIIECNLPLGKNYVILVVTAKSGEEGFDQSTIGVFDTTGPVLQCPNDMIVEATCPEGAIVNFNVTATDLVDTSPEISCSPPSGSMFPLGTTKVSCSAKDSSGNWAAPSVFYVTVQDAAPPVITLNGLATMPLECGVDSYTEEGATATDICDGDVPVIIGGDTVDTSTCGTYLVTYDATDASGNVAEQVIRTVIVEDTMPPVLTCPDDIAVSGGFGGAEVTYDPTATDECDANPAVTTDIASGSFFETGVTTVTATAADSSGNSSTCTFDVIVSCFGINEVKIKTEAGKKGDDIKIKGTFNPGVPIDLMIDDVMYTIDDGQGHVFSFLIPAGSFELEGKGDKDKFHSPKGSVPDIKAKFDFDKCKFELKVKKVDGISEITSQDLTIILQAGTNIGEETVKVRTKRNHLEYKRKPKLNYSPVKGEIVTSE